MAGRLSLVTASNSMTQQPQISEEKAPPSASRQIRASTAENWFEAHIDLAVAIIVTAGFLLRLWIAHGTFLNPDEALHFRAANTPSWWLTYQRSLGIAHPPLLVFLLHFWRAFGMSELVLRLPSVIAGTLFCWIFYAWVANNFSRTAARVSLIFVSFLPPMIELSAELRHYALLLVFCASAMYFLDEALSRNSAWRMSVSLLCLYLALLSHYSAVFFAAWLAVYALVRLRSSSPSARVLITWSAGQVGALGICLFLYVVYISGLSRALADPTSCAASCRMLISSTPIISLIATTPFCSSLPEPEACSNSYLGSWQWAMSCFRSLSWESYYSSDHNRIQRSPA